MHHEPSTIHPNPSTLNTQGDGAKVQLLPETLIPTPSTLKPSPSAISPQPNPSALHPKPQNVRLRIPTVNMGGVDPVKSDIAVTVFRQVESSASDDHMESIAGDCAGMRGDSDETGGDTTSDTGVRP